MKIFDQLAEKYDAVVECHTARWERDGVAFLYENGKVITEGWPDKKLKTIKPIVKYVNHVVSPEVFVYSISGGRTSGVMADLFNAISSPLQIDEFIFMDTGAEHPKTYEFLRNIQRVLGVRITAIKAYISPLPKVGPVPVVVPLESCKWDLEVWQQLLIKDGTPYIGGAFCTDRMKTEIHRKYCTKKYGKGKYTTWLGIRRDEPSRLWGQSAYPALRKAGISPDQCADLFVSARADRDLSCIPASAMEEVQERCETLDRSKIRYMAEILDYDEADVRERWAGMPFDLEIEQAEGNCLFCIKKRPKKVALAAKLNPELAQAFLKLLESPFVRDLDLKHGPLVMYRDRMSFRSILETYAGWTADEIRETLQNYPDEGGCTSSCGIDADI